jgi:Arabinose efflux permease
MNSSLHNGTAFHPLPSIIRVMIASMLEYTAVALLWPVFPLWAEGISSSDTQIGVVSTLALGVGLIAARPVAGRIMEGRRRAPTYIIGLAISGLACLLYPNLPSFYWLIVLRFIHGFGFGLSTTSGITTINDLAPLDRRGQIMAYYGAINALALILGPSLGWWLFTHWDFTLTSYAVAVGSTLAIIPLIALPEPVKPRITGKAPMFEALRGTPMKVIVVGHFLFFLVHGAVVTFLPLHMVGYNGFMNVQLFLIAQGCTIIAVRVLLGRKFDTIGRLPFVFGGLVTLSVAVVGIGIGGSDAIYLAAGIIYGISFGCYVAAASALVGDVTRIEIRARAFALFMCALDLGFTFGGLAFGPISDLIERSGAFLVAGVIPIVAITLYAMSRHQFTAYKE